MRLFKQKTDGFWFVFWSVNDGQSYTALRVDNRRMLTGSDPQELIQQLLQPEATKIVSKKK